MRTIRILLMSFFVLSSSFCAANNDNFNQAEMAEKIYIIHDQIFLTESGIFVEVGDTVIPVNQINYDGEGIYISPYMIWTKEQCPEGHNIRCQRCHGCDWRRCKYACWCR